ncbi:MAG: hypothetical protein ACOCQG_05795, partial [Candidatus Nanoarchaeia archaeon]
LPSKRFLNEIGLGIIMDEERIKKIEERLKAVEEKLEEHDNYIKSDLKQEFAEKSKLEKLSERIDFIDEKLERRSQ